ncbi:MAG: hypothetical protein E2P02_07700 [Acidobacteria bacterium]|nr:MAG: hypothetical protein E2P02_07700 [Acidobacteriota bacterium]
MVTPEGRVKILDFGLAKAFADEEVEPVPSSLSPTLTKGTALGAVLGTASYMSPEQARGKAVDKRTDVWAFGCCVYESVTGRKTFDGETVTDILAAVVKTEPDWAAVPTTLRRLLRRCLAKDPRRRLKDIADARLELEEPEETVVEPVLVRRSSLLPWILATASLMAATGLLVSRGAREDERVHRFQIAVPDFLRPDYSWSPDLSPDGERIVFTAIDESGRPTLWLRSFDALEVQKLPGTEGAQFPFWSPDSRRVGFFAESELRIVDLTGAPPRKLCDLVRFGRGGTWNDDGVILFSDGSGLTRVAETGGRTETVTEVDAAQRFHRWPAFLPDGEHFLFTAWSDVGEHSILVGSLSGEEPVHLLNAYSRVVYSDSHILYARNDALMAQPFDAGALELSGDPVSVVDGVASNEIGLAPFSLSANGVLAYGTLSGGRRLVRLDKVGKELKGHELEGALNQVRLSPDGKNAALQTVDRELADIWLLDRTRGVSERLSFDPGWDSSPVWSPDGRRIAYRTERGGGSIAVIDLDARETDVTKMLLGGRVRLGRQTGPPTDAF